MFWDTGSDSFKFGLLELPQGSVQQDLNSGLPVVP